MEPRNYKSGELVWVLASKRLGWWPGIVENVDLLRRDLKEDVTDKTIAVVKFFNEENYQFVEDRTVICAYNSAKKEEYISLGMKKYFEKKRLNETSSTFMKFPVDVGQAEKLSGGDPKIVEREQFQPKKPVPAQSKYKDIFVDPKAKELKIKSPAKPTASPRRPGRPSTSSPVTKVSHPRFQGQSDHEVRIRKQEKSPTVVTSNEYRCDSCTFQTSRLNLMVLHQKMHLTGTPQQKAGQKRPLSPAKKTAAKRNKKSVENNDGDLFDQVKRNLEAKEGGGKASPQPKTTNKASATPKTPRTPKTSKSPTTAATPKAPTTTQLNPKKKWLKSSLQKENPEVKIKLMADWEEEDEEEKQLQQQKQQREAAEAASKAIKQLESDSDQDHRPVISDLVQKHSDDEDDEEEVVNVKSIVEQEADEATATEESLAGISAEIDKLNADLDASSREAMEIAKVNGDHEPVNGTEPVTSNGTAKSDDEIRKDVASLLAETSVPVLPEILHKTVDEPVADSPAEPMEQEEPVESHDENGVEVDTSNEGGNNILMQVEGGETYMVVWEPGSNIQEFLACQGEDGSGATTQTLLIDPTSLQAGSDLENLIQMAVAASNAPPPNEQSNPTLPTKVERRRSTNSMPAKGKSKQLSVADELLKRHGDAVNQELSVNAVVWARVSATMFVPGAVIEACDAKTLRLAAFDVDRPQNQRKYQRNRVIPAFHHQLNVELLNFVRAKNKAAVGTKLNLSFDHASKFAELRSSTNFAQLTVRQYLKCCNRSPVKLFADRYLTASPDEEIQDIHDTIIDSDSSSDEPLTDSTESDKKLQYVEDMIDQHVLTEACIKHLAEYVALPSERMSLYERQNWSQLSRLATTGILENSRKLYSKIADFLSDNVHRVRKLVEGKDHKRMFILDLLLPEALCYGVQKAFDVGPNDAFNMVVYGLKDLNKSVDCIFTNRFKN